MKRTSALLASGLVVIFLASCTTVEYVPTQTGCTPPEWPLLPTVDRGELWDAIGDEKYRVIERYINTLYGHAKDQAVMLREICS